jgi:hypothetical protein
MFVTAWMLAALVGLAPCSATAEIVVAVVMSGLDNPRGLAFGPDGGLYVAETGRGGTGPSIVLPPNETVFYGTSGAVSRLLGGVQERVLTGLPSLALDGGARARGLHDIGFSASGEAFGVFGWGGNPALRSNLGAAGSDFARLVRLPLAGTGTVDGIADIGAYESSANPDGGAFDTNPYGLLVTPAGGFVVADAGGNDIIGLTAGGAVSTLSVLPPNPNPPMFQAVPTSVALGPDGAYYIGQLTGGPFVPGAANVYRLDPVSGDRTVAYSGFTNIIDLTFGADGSLYVLQISRDGLASPTGPVPGALIRIDLTTGIRTTIISDGLNFPGGVVAGPDGALYVSNFGVSAGGGQVLRIIIPEPSSVVLLTACLVVLIGVRRKRGGPNRTVEKAAQRRLVLTSGRLDQQ